MLNKNRAVIATIGVIGVCIITVILYLIVFNSKDSDTTAQTVQERASALDDMARRGEATASMSGYDELIQNTTDQKEKRQLYIGKSIAAYNNNDYDDALLAAKAADDIDSDHITLGALADISEAKGDIEAAIQYFKRAAVEAIQANIVDDYYSTKAQELKNASTIE